jgi:hypothetical protein
VSGALRIGQPARARDEVLRRRDGRIVRALPDERRYSTRALLHTEESLVRHALQARARGVGLASNHATERSIVEIAEQLGHNPTVCLDTYGHVMRELAGGERVSAEEQIVLARNALSADGGQLGLFST